MCKIFRSSRINIPDEPADLKEDHVSLQSARNLIGGKSSQPGAIKSISEVTYKINYKGGINAVILTKRFDRRYIRGYKNDNHIYLQFHFQATYSTSDALEIKKKKAELIELLNLNNEEVVEYLESKRQNFRSRIEHAIESKIEQNLKNKQA
ncbi:hypothetical protein [Pedobacter antarcticus]|uniref:hypothetical protein n=1 Tax=Pedobacter antarcticus TaxID=34086 RepID=UPI0029308687|nr:hypothetical protein [Pedobacter antarcticus]